MVDVMCPLSFEDLDALLADEQLPSELAAVFEDPARTIEFTGGYEMKLTEAEARVLFAYAKSHEMRRLEFANLARPGGNVTGLSEVSAELSAKRLELLKEAAPGTSTIAVLVDRSHPTNALELKNTELAARRLGLVIAAFDVPANRRFEEVFAGMARSRANALVVLPGDVTTTHRDAILGLALKHRLPTLYGWRLGPEAGSLMSYGVDIAENFRQAAAYVDKILKGAKPADLPVEQPTKFELVINMKTAKALGLTIPQSLLQRADQVIE